MKRIILALILTGLFAGAAAPDAHADVIVIRHHHRHHFYHPHVVWVPGHHVGRFWHRHWVPGHWAPV